MESIDFLLSGGVIAALVAGIFSTIVAMINARRVSKMEQERKRFKLNESRLTLFQEAYRQYWQIERPFTIFREVFRGDPVEQSTLQAQANRSEESCKAYFELMQSLKPYCDEDLFSKWLIKVKAHDAAVELGREKIRAYGSASSKDIIASNVDMEEACEEVLVEQIRRLIN